ncbi:MAG TPA: hypothetical protein PLS50_08910, partial [Candidatus Dojkabacteria bacterium]|nr:hypothetical protein [Candidatus Dojkabacteria bacterium]
MARIIGSIILFVLPLILLIQSVAKNFYNHLFIYFTIISWMLGIALLIRIDAWSKRKVLALIHLAVVCIFVTAIIADQLYKAYNIQEREILVNKSTSNLIFISENLLYLGVYLGVTVFFIDIFLL